MMSIFSVTASVPIAQASIESDKKMDWRLLAVTIAEVCLQLLASLWAVFVFSLFTPLCITPVVLPLVALCSVSVSPYILKPSPLRPLPSGAPRGIECEGKNSWVNAQFQMLLADERLMQWLRSDECPRSLRPFKEFAKAYDLAMQEGQPIVSAKSQSLRSCLSWIGNIRSSCSAEEDITEAMRPIFNRLPELFWVNLQERKRCAARVGQVQISPAHAYRPPETKQSCGYVSLEISERAPSLDDLMERYFKTPINDPNHCLSLLGIDGQHYNYPVIEEIRSFDSPPPSLWISFKRFQDNQKIDIPVDIPDTYTIRSFSQDPVRYRLDAIALHQGATKSEGHYIALRFDKRDGYWYKIDDDKVVQISYGEMRKYLSQAHQVHFSRV